MNELYRLSGLGRTVVRSGENALGSVKFPFAGCLAPVLGLYA